MQVIRDRRTHRRSSVTSSQIAALAHHKTGSANDLGSSANRLTSSGKQLWTSSGGGSSRTAPPPPLPTAAEADEEADALGGEQSAEKSLV